MGNTQTPEGADHDFYRRPEDGREQRPVQIVDDGPVPDAGAERVGGASAVAAGVSAGTEDRAALDARDQTPQSFPAPPRSRFNYSLAAAWVLVGLLLAHGLAWLTGAFPVPDFDPTTGIATGEMPSEFVMNLSSMGPAPFLLGLLGAFTLLAVQAAGFRRGGR
ncbi:hypothetical protein [Arthrobacter koreensis]|uniref:hypothetical protein n=1 Tax=Arthrobacter koreensis TaxID=199136 RepID=UPI002DBCEE07|nr:hypothetical protein [Arthrobacter koreensis]MEB7503957.1 hypothetical protein [Arthrobacter koreensis]